MVKMAPSPERTQGGRKGDPLTVFKCAGHCTHLALVWGRVQTASSGTRSNELHSAASEVRVSDRELYPWVKSRGRDRSTAGTPGRSCTKLHRSSRHSRRAPPYVLPGRSWGVSSLRANSDQNRAACRNSTLSDRREMTLLEKGWFPLRPLTVGVAVDLRREHGSPLMGGRRRSWPACVPFLCVAFGGEVAGDAPPPVGD